MAEELANQSEDRDQRLIELRHTIIDTFDKLMGEIGISAGGNSAIPVPRQFSNVQRQHHESMELQQLHAWKEKMMAIHEQRGKILREVLVDHAKAERDLARNDLHQNSLRFGHYTKGSFGGRIHEYWEEGQEYKDITAQLESIQQAIEKVAQDKTDFLMQIQMLKSFNSGEIEAEKLEQDHKLVHEMAILQFHETSLKKEFDDLLSKKHVHERGKAIYKLEAKRIQQEGASLFGGFPEYQNRYLLLKFLGKGGFGEVYKAFDMENNEYVACKMHRLGSQISENEKHNTLRHMEREWDVHKTLVHPHIIRHLDNFTIDNNTFCTVLELCSGKDLQFALTRVRFFQENDAKILILQILRGLAYLDGLDKRIIHSDIKPPNILLTNDRVAKISDFGLCKVMEVGSESMELTSRGGTICYLPPECLVKGAKRRISTKVDVWSAGVVFYQLLFGRVPFGFGPNKSPADIEREIINGVLRFPSTPTISSEAMDFIRNCLTYDHALRPSAGTLLQDPYLRLSGNNV